MEYEIGQEIELIHDNKTIKLKIIKAKESNCKGCFFKSNKSSCIRNNYNNMKDAFCTPMFRKDKKNIIYKQIK